MRLGIDLRLHAYAPGGIATYSQRLAEHLAPLLPPDALWLLQHRKETQPLALPGAR
ncbi:MAG: glycosyltransferase family 1 protein, partial [Chloroflexi bacterium]|nr:glycosyltransferase family 1 protein [Chloroflexota bacterium]